jgi:hypothetical protein
MIRPRSTWLIGLVVVLAGCPAGPKDYEPYSTSDRTLFMPTFRAAAPEPVYSRTRWAHLPEVLPQREMPGDDKREGGPETGPALRPVFQLTLNKASLEETARVLAAMARYSSYTAPSIAQNSFSIENLGTIDELGRIIGEKAGIQVVIDHDNKEVRFLAPAAETPRLFSE